MKEKRNCAVCSAEFLEYQCSPRRCCSRKCGYRMRDLRGPRNPAWKGGRIKLKTGYIAIYAPEHPRAAKGKNPWVYEHRLVMEKMLGRFLEPHEVVHHLNGDKADNNPDNLGLLESQAKHAALHARERL